MKPKLDNLFLESNKILNSRKMRYFIGLFSVGQGLIRLNLFANGQYPKVNFLNDTIFGLSLFILGILLFITTNNKIRFSFFSRIISSLSAAAYGMLAISILDTNIIGTWSNILITAFLIIETMSISEC